MNGGRGREDWKTEGFWQRARVWVREGVGRGGSWAREGRGGGWEEKGRGMIWGRGGGGGGSSLTDLTLFMDRYDQQSPPPTPILLT